MCFSEPMSWAALFAGTAANAAAALACLRRPVALGLIGGFQWGLLMQVVDALAWRALREGWGQGARRALSRAALLLNTSQPLVLLACLAALAGRAPSPATALATAAYLAAMAANLAGRTTPVSMFPVDSHDGSACRHMVYDWWMLDGKRNKIDPSNPFGAFTVISMAVLYIVCMLSVMLDYSGPRGWPVMAYFVSGVVISNALYPCGPASVWCWSVASAGPVVWAWSRT